MGSSQSHSSLHDEQGQGGPDTLESILCSKDDKQRARLKKCFRSYKQLLKDVAFLNSTVSPVFVEPSSGLYLHFTVYTKIQHKILRRFFWKYKDNIIVVAKLMHVNAPLVPEETPHVIAKTGDSTTQQGPSTTGPPVDTTATDTPTGDDQKTEDNHHQSTEGGGTGPGGTRGGHDGKQSQTHPSQPSPVGSGTATGLLSASNTQKPVLTRQRSLPAASKGEALAWWLLHAELTRVTGTATAPDSSPGGGGDGKTSSSSESKAEHLEAGYWNYEYTAPTVTHPSPGSPVRHAAASFPHRTPSCQLRCLSLPEFYALYLYMSQHFRELAYAADFAVAKWLAHRQRLWAPPRLYVPSPWRPFLEGFVLGQVNRRLRQTAGADKDRKGRLVQATGAQAKGGEAEGKCGAAPAGKPSQGARGTSGKGGGGKGGGESSSSASASAPNTTSGKPSDAPSDAPHTSDQTDTDHSGSTGQSKEQKEGSAEDIDTCCICLETMSDTALPCTHAFCETCISSWMENDDTCPICRSSTEDLDTGDMWVLDSQQVDPTEEPETGPRVYRILMTPHVFVAKRRPYRGTE